MNLNRLQTLNSFDHLMAVEVEADYGYRYWVPCRESEVDAVIKAETDIPGYGLSDIDHNGKCDCLASWDEWVFLLDFRSIAR
jgi:hypothetical protein